MSVYEQRLADDKKAIRERVSRVGETAVRAVSDAVAAMLSRDEQACARIILGDLPINREIRAVDKACHAFIARHLPSAGHLRFISSVLRMNVAIERVGDYAVTIAREGVQLSSDPPQELASELARYVEQSCSAFRQAVRAFAEQNESLARETKANAQSVGRRYAQIFRDLVVVGERLSTADAFALFAVSRRLERVADQAKNLCEETLFELTGETKPPKRYKILFVASDDLLTAKFAAALASKAFPESGAYSATGPEKGSTSPALVKLQNELSLDLEHIAVSPLRDGDGPHKRYSAPEGLNEFHAVVCLGAEARKLIEQVPYSTALLRWDVPALSTEEAELRSLGERLRVEIRELMVTMRGEGAS